MIYYQVKIGSGKIVAGNMHEFNRREEFANNRNFSKYNGGKGLKGAEMVAEDVSVWVVVEDEEDLLRSSKLFKKTVATYGEISLDVWKYHRIQLDAYAHTLTTIQGQIRQRIEGFANDEVFYADTYMESVSGMSDYLKKNLESAADLICYTHKRITDMRAHLLGVEIVHADVNCEIKPTRVSLKRAILNQCSPFLDELEKNSVKLRFFFSDDCEVEVDKNMFSLVMYNFFSNAVKYTKQDSEIRLNYSADRNSLDVSMISLKMEKDEIESLSDETVRGKHAKDFPGKGIGLFVLQRALELMNKPRMYISPNYMVNLSIDGNLYNENHFTFSL